MSSKFWDYIERHITGLMIMGSAIIALVAVIVFGADKGAFSFVVIGGILLVGGVFFFVLSAYYFKLKKGEAIPKIIELLVKPERWKLFFVPVIVSLGILVLFFMLGTLHYPMDQGQAQSLVGEVAAELPSQPSLTSIFLHNFGLALLMLIPIFGPIFGVYSAYAMGRVFAAAATIGASRYGGTYFPLLFDRYVFGQAFFWLEVLAYSIMIAQSVTITLMIAKARKVGFRAYKRKDIGILGLMILAGAVVLFIAAGIEAEALGAV